MIAPGAGVRICLASGAAGRFTPVLDDGRVAVVDNPAERAFEAVTPGRGRFLVAGSDAGGLVLAEAMTVIEVATLSDLVPEVGLSDIVSRMGAAEASRFEERLPWTWKADREAERKAAWSQALSDRRRGCACASPFEGRRRSCKGQVECSGQAT